MEVIRCSSDIICEVGVAENSVSVKLVVTDHFVTVVVTSSPNLVIISLVVYRQFCFQHSKGYYSDPLPLSEESIRGIVPLLLFPLPF